MRGDEVLFQARVTAALLSLEGRPQRLPKDMIARFAPLLV
jgi:acyl-CoA thioesterase FadM